MNFEQDIEFSLQHLQNGNTILYPTDTVWGIGCDACNEKAVEKIFKIKQRNEQKALIVLVADIDMLLKYIEMTDVQLIHNLLEKYQDRPTTIIFNKSKNLAANVSANASVAIRISNEKFTQELITKFGKPIISTSANISGEPTAAIYTAINENIKNQVDYIVSYRQEDYSISNPSRIISFENNSIKIIRE